MLPEPHYPRWPLPCPEGEARVRVGHGASASWFPAVLSCLLFGRGGKGEEGEKKGKRDRRRRRKGRKGMTRIRTRGRRKGENERVKERMKEKERERKIMGK